MERKIWKRRETENGNYIVIIIKTDFIMETDPQDSSRKN